MCVAGNTTMAHFLLGLDPYQLCRAPYVPVANRFPVVRASELGLGVNPAAPVIVLPNVGSYVGGDALAGVLVSGMNARERVSLLVDIGTNAEIVVGNREFLLVGAGSAGPGLEGGVVRHGMRAAPGAIERIAIDPRTLLPTFAVIGGGAPRGICGSGLIDLMAELFSAGIVDGRGKFVLPSPSPRVVVRAGFPCFVVAGAATTAGGGEILFTQADMDNLMLSKAAMYTMLTVMTEAAGVAFDELEQFFIAGAFGAYVAADKAVTIGMVPDIELSKFTLLGNSSLEGAKRVLLSTAALERIEDIGRQMTYVEMNESREFMNGFMAARFLPHTDMDLFPSVRERLVRPPPRSGVLESPVLTTGRPGSTYQGRDGATRLCEETRGSVGWWRLSGSRRRRRTSGCARGRRCWSAPMTTRRGSPGFASRARSRSRSSAPAAPCCPGIRRSSSTATEAGRRPPPVRRPRTSCSVSRTPRLFSAGRAAGRRPASASRATPPPR